jgi:hypothetical protein
MEQPKTPSWPLEGQASTPLIRVLLRELRMERQGPTELVLTVTLPRRHPVDLLAFEDDL